MEAKAYAAVAFELGLVPEHAAAYRKEVVKLAEANGKIFSEYDIGYPLAEAAARANDMKTIEFAVDRAFDSRSKAECLANAAAIFAERSKTEPAKQMLTRAQQVMAELSEDEDPTSVKSSLANAMLYLV